MKSSNSSTAEQSNRFSLCQSLEYRLKHEREQHAVTAKILKGEQENVRILQAALEDSKRFAATLITGNRLDEDALATAIHGIQQKVDQIAEQVARLLASSYTRLPINVGNDLGQSKIPVDGQHRAIEASPVQKRTSRLLHPIRNGQCSPTRLDNIAPKCASKSNALPDSHSFVHKDLKQLHWGSVDRDAFQRADEAQQDEKNELHKAEEHRNHHCNAEMNGSNQHKPHANGRSQREFHSLDQAFESEFFLKATHLGSSMVANEMPDNPPRPAPHFSQSDDNIHDINATTSDVLQKSDSATLGPARDINRVS